jgi:anti-sigma28 factor (negative regulator of flagellin synthesis)
MTVNRIDGASANLPEPERNRPRATPPRSPQDEVHLSSRQPVAPKEPTYSPKTVRRAQAAPSASRAEKTMAPDARAQKVQAIKDRIQAGVYDSQEIIERVVDRLLEKWQIDPGQEPGGSDA